MSQAPFVVLKIQPRRNTETPVCMGIPFKWGKILKRLHIGHLSTKEQSEAGKWSREWEAGISGEMVIGGAAGSGQRLGN